MKVCIIGPSKKFMSGISYFTIDLANAFSEKTDVCVVTLRNLLPKFLFPGKNRVGKKISDLEFNKNIKVFDGIDWYLVPSFFKAIKFIKGYKKDLSEEFILNLHKIILNNISERFAGKYRETDVRIFGSDVKMPNYHFVPQLVKSLIYWYKENKNKYHQFELAVLISMKLVTIHPFVDGNGRVSRLIMNFMLNKKAYPWINIYNKHRQDYLTAVRKANDENYSLIFPFLIKTLNENLDDFKII
jgi:fido (protein-threonine AMPylation protein)